MGLFEGSFNAPLTWSQDALPYTSRTLKYPAWHSTVRGDHRIVGMAGSMVGLADTKLSNIDNPAGLAMTVGDTGIEFMRNAVTDRHLVATEGIEFTDFAASASHYPWGFGYAAWTPLSQSATYSLSPNSTMTPTIEATEFRFSAARVLLKNKLSLGASLVFAKSSQTLSISNPAETLRDSGTAWSGSLGLMIQFPKRWIAGVSYHLPYTTTNQQFPQNSNGIENFFQPASSPARVGLGVSWIPNRFFQFGSSLYFIGTDENTALLRDESARVGQTITLQPRLGLSYQWIDYQELQGTFTLGTYYEVSRISDRSDRIHFNSGLLIRPWVLSFGWTIDIATDYTNQIFTAGVDVGKIFKKLGWLPKTYEPPRAGLFPKANRYSDAGLPRPLVKRWKQREKVDLIEAGKNLPKAIQKDLKDTKKGIEGFFERLGDVPNQIKKGMDRIDDAPSKN